MTIRQDKILNYSILKQTNIEQFRNKKPFPFNQYSGLLKKGKYEQLRNELPCTELFEKQKGNYRRYGQASHDRLSLDFSSNLAISDNWKIFIEELESGQYREFICNLLKTNKFHFKYHWHYTPSAASVSPHCDAEWKLGSHIFYFNSKDDWDQNWGGQTVILDDEGKKSFKTAPKFNEFKRQIEIPCIDSHSLLFKRTDHSWHGVRRIQCPPNKLRKVFIVEFRQNKISNTIRSWFQK